MTLNLKKTAVNAMIAGAFATTMASAASDVNAMGADTEKCYGVVKAGKNDCANAAGTHACAGQAATDADGGEWLSLPKGVCERLAGASTTPIEADAEPTEDDKTHDTAHDGDHHG